MQHKMPVLSFVFLQSTIGKNNPAKSAGLMLFFILFCRVFAHYKFADIVVDHFYICFVKVNHMA